MGFRSPGSASPSPGASNLSASFAGSLNDPLNECRLCKILSGNKNRELLPATRRFVPILSPPLFSFAYFVSRDNIATAFALPLNDRVATPQPFSKTDLCLAAPAAA
jgi:hypothetical protein